ncbi:MAG: hypothetical protein KatS3mg060_2283 [Dehalococcoidia bacterium]|nr:MAG: hypothetical protein KatS3mg060_2283 [Dehalococcoidia bacterium]
MPVEEVVVGDIVVVRPGEKIPVDGVVVEGTRRSTRSMITGESMPVDKPGGRGHRRHVNQTGSLRFRATKVGKDTALAQIVRMVRTPRLEGADPAARRRGLGYFSPAVMILAIIGFVIWYDFGPAPACAYAASSRSRR